MSARSQESGAATRGIWMSFGDMSQRRVMDPVASVTQLRVWEGL